MNLSRLLLVLLAILCGIAPNAAHAAYIASIQDGTVTIASGQTSGTATISSVDASRTLIVWRGQRRNSSGGAVLNNLLARLTLTNSTTVTANCNTGADTTITLPFTAIEFGSDLVDSAQYGTVTISNGSFSNTATISNVTTSRSAIFWLGESTGEPASQWDDALMRVALTNGTTVTGTSGDDVENKTASFVVLQFASGVTDSVQARSVSKSGTNLTDTDTLSSVTMADTIIAWGGMTTTATTANGNDVLTAIELTSTTNVNLVRGDAGSTARTVNYTAIDFAPGVMTSVQRNVFSYTGTLSTTSHNDTISGVNTGMSAAAQLGILNIDVASSAPGAYITTTSLANSTTAQMAWNTNSSADHGQGYEVWEFSTGPATGNLVKTWNGLADASVKAANDNARASIKARQGLSAQ